MKKRISIKPLTVYNETWMCCPLSDFFFKCLVKKLDAGSELMEAVVNLRQCVDLIYESGKISWSLDYHITKVKTMVLAQDDIGITEEFESLVNILKWLV